MKKFRSVIAIMLAITIATSIGMFAMGYHIGYGDAEMEAKASKVGTEEDWVNVFGDYDPTPVTWDASKYQEGSKPSYTDWNSLGLCGIYPPADVFDDIKSTLKPEIRACILNSYLENDSNFPLDNKDKMVLDWYGQHDWDDIRPYVMKDDTKEEPVEETTPEEPIEDNIAPMSETPEETTEPEVEEEEPAEPEYQVYTVQAGDSFWKIAKQFYGNGNLYWYIVATNNWDRSRQALRVGTELKIYEYDESQMDTTSNALVSYSSGSDDDHEFRTWSQETVDSVDTSNMTYLGEYHITGYDPYCYHCNGKTDGITASTRQAILNYTVAVKGLDFGTKLYIEGYGIYEVMDRPGNSGIIDIACASHDLCYQVTRRNVPVYIVE